MDDLPGWKWMVAFVGHLEGGGVEVFQNEEGLAYVFEQRRDALETIQGHLLEDYRELVPIYVSTRAP